MKRINLLPTDIAERRRAARRTYALVLVGVAVVGLLIVVWVLRQAKLNSEEDRLAEAQSQVKILQAQRDELNEFALLEQTVLQKEKTLAAVMVDDVHWSRIITELSMVIPEESWLTAFTGTSAEPAAAAQAEAAAQLAGPPALGTLAFEGVTFEFPDVAKWIIRLQGMKSLQNVWVNNAERGEIGSRHVVNFSSSADLSSESASGRYRQGAAQ